MVRIFLFEASAHGLDVDAPVSKKSIAQDKDEDESENEESEEVGEDEDVESEDVESVPEEGNGSKKRKREVDDEVHDSGDDEGEDIFSKGRVIKSKKEAKPVSSSAAVPTASAAVQKGSGIVKVIERGSRVRRDESDGDLLQHVTEERTLEGWD